MTEKRFTVERFIEDYKSHIIDNEGKIETLSEFVDYLNALHEENEELKKQIGNLEHTKDFCADVCADCKRLEKENEQLKSEIDGPLTDEFCLSVPITSVLVDKSLLEEILNTLDSYDGLFVVIEKEYVQLDFEILIGKIKMVLK